MNNHKLEIIRFYRKNVNLGVISYLKMRPRNDKELKSLRTESFQFFVSQSENYLNIDQCEMWTGLEVDVFNQLVVMLRKRKTMSIPSHIRLIIFLKFMREGISQMSLSRTIGLSQPTVCRIISDAIHDIAKFAPEWICFPKSHAEVYEIEKGFLEINRGLRCFGVIDGKHFKIEKPPHTGSLNMNYKGFFSFNTLFVVDDRNSVIFLQITQNGCNSDAQIFNAGPLLKLLTDPETIPPPRILPFSNTVMPSFILSDNGFALHHSVMMPFRQTALTTEKIKFNSIFSSVRVRVENVFGQITSRFRIFRQSCNLSIANTQQLVVCAAIIHNITIGKRNVVHSKPYVPPHVLPYRNPEEQRAALLNYVLKMNE